MKISFAEQMRRAKPGDEIWSTVKAKAALTVAKRNKREIRTNLFIAISAHGRETVRLTRIDVLK